MRTRAHVTDHLIRKCFFFAQSVNRIRYIYKLEEQAKSRVCKQAFFSFRMNELRKVKHFFAPLFWSKIQSEVQRHEPNLRQEKHVNQSFFLFFWREVQVLELDPVVLKTVSYST